MEWKPVMEKIGVLFLERCSEIRSEICSSEIMGAAQETLLGVPDNLDEMAFDATIMKAVLDGINDRHRVKIGEMAGKMGEVVGNYEKSSDGLDREEEDHIIIARSGLIIRIKKEMALKMLALGSLP